jgi:hypothetical protein
LHTDEDVEQTRVDRVQMLLGLEREIASRIREFDVLALLRLLQALGFEPQEIQFASHHSTTSQVGLIHDIEFLHEPVRLVRIILNMGLLSSQSPLPSYFMKKMDTGEVDTRSFVDFIGYFDHLSLQGYLEQIYPETNRHLFPDWPRTKRRYLHLLNLRSCVTLHWLFQSVFPELGLSVERVSLPRGVKTTPLRLGEVTLGSDAVFGKKTSIPVLGRRVTLLTDAELTDSGQPWPAEIKRRLEEIILPILAAVGMDLEVLLVVQAQKSWAKLQEESYLGYDKLQGGQDLHRRIKVFSGYVLS